MKDGEFNIPNSEFISRYEKQVQENPPVDLGNITLNESVTEASNLEGIVMAGNDGYVLQYQIMLDNCLTGVSLIFIRMWNIISLPDTRKDMVFQ